jgi:hypothetical protein
MPAFELEDLRYQQDAVRAVVDVFKGVPRAFEHAMVGNRCRLTWEQISGNLQAVSELIAAQGDLAYISLQLIVGLVPMAGFTWLALIATHRLRHTHAITEDYAYKAALAQAYQGYTQSAESNNQSDTLAQLQATLIQQLESSPVRFLSEKPRGLAMSELLKYKQLLEELDRHGLVGAAVEFLSDYFGRPRK